MIKSQFIIYGNSKTGHFPVVNGYVLRNGNHWFGMHKTFMDGEEVWSLTVCYYGLRYKTYPTRKAAEAAAKSEETCDEIDRLLTFDDNRSKYFDDLRAKMEQAYIDYHDNAELNKMWERMYWKG